jgi:uncharacterized protein (TIGR02611 family)
MQDLHENWRKVPTTIRKPLVFMVGFAVVLAGIIMLVIPGPGWAGIFLGFAILATEFAFAERVRDWLVNFLKGLIRSTTDWFRRVSQSSKSKK